MLVVMQRRVWVLAATAAVLTACGGEKFTVATDDAGANGSGGAAGVNTDCQSRGDCVLVPRDCCGTCYGQPPLTESTVVAMNENAVDAYREASCALPGAAWCQDYDCADTVSNAMGLSASCDNFQCVVSSTSPYGTAP